MSDDKERPRYTGDGPDLGMVCTCDPEDMTAARTALSETVSRYRLDREIVVSELVQLLHIRYQVNGISITTDMWFAIAFDVGYGEAKVRGVIQCDEVEHGLVAILRHLDATELREAE